MGCTASKQIDTSATVAIYRPPPSSFAVFDINAIQEPWLMVENKMAEQQLDEKNPTRIQVLDKLNKFDLVSGPPKSWDEISKALEDLKPTLRDSEKHAASPEQNNVPFNSPAHDSDFPLKKIKRKSFSFHTLDELDNKKATPELKISDSLRPAEFKWPEFTKTESKSVHTESKSVHTESKSVHTESKPVQTELKSNQSESVKNRLKENVFLVRDRLEREKEGKAAKFDEMMKNRRDPLSQFPAICPPAGADSVVLYTTSLGGVRRTYEDCNKLRSILDGHRIIYDERDVALHGEFLKELKDLLSSLYREDENGMARNWSVPRLFVKGRYIGGVDEVVELNELSRLGRILNYARVERGVGRQACEGCGGARFVPCMECGGSCKVVAGAGGSKERCPKCNENGLVHCSLCV